MKGTSVKATIIDASTLVITAIGRLRINSPAESGRKARGKNDEMKLKLIEKISPKKKTKLKPLMLSRLIISL